MTSKKDLLRDGTVAMLRATRGDGVDRCLTGSQVSVIQQRHVLPAMVVASLYLRLLKAGMPRADALGWLHVAATELDDLEGEAWDAFVEQQQRYPWRRVAWLMHGAGVVSAEEQERLWTEGLDRTMLLSMAALRGHDLPERLAHPRPKRPKRSRTGSGDEPDHTT